MPLEAIFISLDLMPPTHAGARGKLQLKGSPKDLQTAPTSERLKSDSSQTLPNL